jgi:TP901 family phage tail tape measure protein
MQTVFDAYNKTFIQSADRIRRTITGYKAELQKASGTFKLEPIYDDAYISSISKAIGDSDKLTKALKGVAGANKEILAVNEKLANLQVKTGNKAVEATKGKLQAQSELKQLRATPEAQLVDRAKSLLAQATSPDAAFFRGPTTIKDLQRELDDITNKAIKKYGAGITSTGRQQYKSPAGRFISEPEAQKLISNNAPAIAKAIQVGAAAPQLAPVIKSRTELVNKLSAPLDAAIGKITADIAAFDKTIAKLGAVEGKAIAAAGRAEERIRAANAPAFAKVDRAARGTPPIDRDLATVLSQSKELKKGLLASGLGAGKTFGTKEFQKALSLQEASVSSYVNNLRTGVKTVQGSFRDLDTGLLNQFTADIDKNGKVVGRWGGQLAGAGQFLNQTVRNLQKVIQWTVATTVVFGTLAAVVTQLQDINELNTSLARLSITAQTSGEQTRILFKDIAQVAYDTATPLKELVKVSDDIALATREAGQSSDEWKQKILDLTNAVGIFTNLTGVETVAAADQLSAAFKQLGIAPEGLVGVLNKVTAVAGGQATSIAEIVKALGSVAGAANAAQLTLDEQIAAVQVLSQVTSKSADEIATSFKNLFGSISSVGSVKALEKFGIAVRDESGNLRPFLDIYRDIADAIGKGVIPQGKVQDVLRGISGGPRRAPDAAALLNALPLIEQAIEKSANASNEALVANAKILDTNAAKIQQFQNAVDFQIFQKFGQVIADATANLAAFGTTMLNVFGGIPTELIGTLIQLTAIIVATRTFGGLLQKIGILDAFRGLITGLGSFRTSLKAAAVEASVLQNYVTGVSAKGKTQFVGGISEKTARQRAEAGLTTVGGASALLRNNLGKAAVIGGAGALAIGAGALNQGQNVGGLLQGVGGLATVLNPAVGLAIFGIGTALQFMTKSADTAKKSQAELSSEIYTGIQNLKEAQTTANGYAEAQKKAADQLLILQGQTKLSADEQALLATTTEQYVTATLALASANQTVSQTFDELLVKLPSLAAEYQATKIALAGLQTGSLESQQLEQRLLQDILKGLGLGIYAGETISPTKTFVPVPREPGTQVQRIDRVGQELVDLSTIADDPSKLRQVFKVYEDGFVAFNKIPANAANIAYLQNALAQIIELGDASGFTSEEIKALTKTILGLAVDTSTVTREAAIVAQNKADTLFRQSVGQLRGEPLANTLIADTILEALSTVRQFAPPGRPGPFGTTDTRAQEALSGTFNQINQLRGKGVAIPNALIIEAAANSLKLQQSTEGFSNLYEQLADKGVPALNTAFYELAQTYGLNNEQLKSLREQLNLTAVDAQVVAEQISAAIETARRTADTSYAERALKLVIAENSGDFEKNAAGLATLVAQNEQAHRTNLQLIDSFSTLSESSMVDLNNALAGVVGLQGLYITEAQQADTENFNAAESIAAMTENLVENAIAAGVNAEGIKKIQEEVAKLIGVLTAIPTYKQVIIEVTTLYNEGGRTGQGGKDVRSQQRLVDAINDQKNAIAEGTDPASIAQQIIDAINAEFGKGLGSQLGQLPKTGGATNKPGLLDIPKEFIDQSSLETIRKGILSPEAKAAGYTNLNDILQRAVKSARGLQSLVPGEDKANKQEIVELLSGTKRILETRGVGEEYLRRALDELAEQIKKQNDLLDKANQIRRIRVGAGDFAAFANVPLNTRTGVSVGGPEGPISINLNINGQLLTPAQFSQLADQIGAALKRQLAGG